MLAFNAALTLHAPWIGALPMEAGLLLVLAASLATMAWLGPAEEPPSEEVTTAAVFALHGYL